MFSIIIAIIAIVFCFAAMIANLANREGGGAFLMLVLILLNGFILKNNIERYNAKKNGEYETVVVNNVIGYSTDTITVINGADTTRTYTLTYWKDYE